jgi:hypothetical protein
VAIVLFNALPETVGRGYAPVRVERVVKLGALSALEVALGQTLTSSALHGKRAEGGFSTVSLIWPCEAWPGD